MIGIKSKEGLLERLASASFLTWMMVIKVFTLKQFIEVYICFVFDLTINI